MKRIDEKQEELLKEQEKQEQAKEEIIENSDLKIVNNKIVDKDGFAVSETTITKEEEKSDIFVEVDGYRQKYVKKAKIFKYLGFGMMIIILAAFIVLMVFITSLPDYLQWTFLGICIALVVGVFVYNYLSKRYLNNQAREYVTKYYETIINHMFKDPKYSEVTINPKGKVDDSFFTNTRLYKDIVSTRSRNVSTFKYKEREYAFAELSAQVVGVKKLEPIFIGKVLKLNIDLPLPGRIVGQIRSGSNLVVPINDIDGLDVIENGNSFTIYSNLNKAKHYIGKEFVNLFKNFKVDKKLLDVTVAVNSDGITVCLDCDDSVMTLPVDGKFNISQINETKNAVENALELIDVILEKVLK